MLFSVNFLFLIIFIFNVKSDPSHLSTHRKLEPLDEFMQDNNFRDHITEIIEAETAEEQAIREIHLIWDYRDVVRDRDGFIRNIQSQMAQQSPQQHARNQQEQNQVVQLLQTAIAFVKQQNSRHRLTEDERRHYRRTVLQHLEALYYLQERIITRYELEILLQNLEMNRRYEQQQRTQEQYTQDHEVLEQRVREQNSYNQLYTEIRRYLHYMLQQAENGQFMLDQHLQELDRFTQRWFALQTLTVRIRERRGHERAQVQHILQQQQQAMKRHMQENCNLKVKENPDKKQKFG